MREIKFRGKADCSIEELNEKGIKHNNGWVYGAYLDEYILTGIIEASDEYVTIETWVRVKPETVGQYTGEKIEGVEIYPGHVFTHPIRLEAYYFVVEWVVSGWQFVTYLKKESKNRGVSHNMGQGYLEEFNLNEMVLVGDVNDNPELLKNCDYSEE